MQGIVLCSRQDERYLTKDVSQSNQGNNEYQGKTFSFQHNIISLRW